MKNDNLYNNAPIGFFDSGIGGLSVYSRFRKILPNENTIYYGDLKNLPYGNKTQSQLIGFASDILNFFQSKRVKAVVIACNTSSALAYDYIKDRYNFKIYPIIQSCSKIIAKEEINRIGIFATEGTVNSGAYPKELIQYNPSLQVKAIACPNWVSIVEHVNDAELNADEDIRHKMAEMLKFNPDKIILGCTHYPYLINKLTEFAPRETFIDPSEIFVNYIKNDLSLNQNETVGYEEFYVSAEPENFLRNSKLFYDVKNLPQVIDKSPVYNN